MRKADKLFQLTNIVRAKQPITANEIAEELDVSVRTVYRYIDDLSVSGIPIYGTAGLGYQLTNQFELPPLNLTENELDALLIGVKMVSGWTGDDLSSSAKSLAAKINAVVPSKLRNEHLPTAYIPSTLDRTDEKKRWDLIHLAIKNNMVLNIDYQTLEGECSSRTIYPLGLFYWGKAWTVGSWCTLRSGYRDFRLDRINSIEVQENFTQTSIINLNAYLSSIKGAGIY